MGNWSHLSWTSSTRCLDKGAYTLLGGGHQDIWNIPNATHVKLGLTLGGVTPHKK